MELYLMRHGLAVGMMEWDGADAKRPLTDAGENQLRKAVSGMGRAHFHPAVLLTSPYLRAKQTAEILSKGLSASAPVVMDALAADAKAKAYQAALLPVKTKSPVLMVGHMPDLMIVASRITEDPLLLESGRFEPGEIMAFQLEWDGDAWANGKLLWRRTLDDWMKL